MTVTAPALESALAQAVGREHVLSDAAALEAASVDGRTPRWIARPGSTEEVGRLLALASAERLAVGPRGGGSALDLGGPPARLDLVLELSRLAAVLDYVPEDMVVGAQAGLTLGGLAAALAPRGQMLALDPWGGSARTLGGVLATNASGPLRYRYGTGRDLLLGARFVQADGTVTWGGARVVKSVTGYDVPKLLVGSLGTLGVITEVTLRLHPAPASSGSWLFSFDSHGGAGEFVAEILGSTLEPDRVEWLSGGALVEAGYPLAAAAVAVSVGTVAEAVRSQGETLAAWARRRGARIVSAPDSFWQAIGATLRAPVVLKLAGEPARLPAWAAAVEAAGSGLGLAVALVGEAGNGVLRAALWGAVDARAWSRELLDPLRDRLTAEAGSLVVERAPAGLKDGVDVWGRVPEPALSVMRRLKAEFDPQGVLNPGRFVGGL